MYIHILSKAFYFEGHNYVKININRTEIYINRNILKVSKHKILLAETFHKQKNRQKCEV